MEDYKKTLTPEDKDRIKDSVLTEKIFDFLIKNSNIIEKNKEDMVESEEINTTNNNDDGEKTE